MVYSIVDSKKVREKSRKCYNYKPQPFPDPKRKRKPTNLNKHKPNKRTKSTKISLRTVSRANHRWGRGGGVKAFLQLANFTLGPDATLNTEIHKNSDRIKAPNSVNASNIKIKLITIINKDEYSWLTLLYARANENQ